MGVRKYTKDLRSSVKGSRNQRHETPASEYYKRNERNSQLHQCENLKSRKVSNDSTMWKVCRNKQTNVDCHPGVTIEFQFHAICSIQVSYRISYKYVIIAVSEVFGIANFKSVNSVFSPRLVYADSRTRISVLVSKYFGSWRYMKIHHIQMYTVPFRKMGIFMRWCVFAHVD